MFVFTVVLRWLARLSGVVIAGGYTLLLAGEILHPHSGPPSTLFEWGGLVLLTVTCIGMLIAWRWELPGAILSLACLLAFTLLVRMNRHTVIVVLAIPGILFTADWLLRRLQTLRPVAR
ncbi:membrane hypothetical protein [Candidatus Sulfopaludibacter sp. SbA6]|nr:membrane hypothetical protein [Candidatus Sulfopaludibacter sp. SbA6]